MAPVWPTWFEGIAASVPSDQTILLNWALKTNSINQFFKILAPSANCSNEKPAERTGDLGPFGLGRV